MAELEKEFKYYLQNKEKFLKDYKGKFIVIKDQRVLGIYDDQMEAIEQTRKEHKLGTFLVHHVQPDEEEQVRFRSRVGL